MDHEQVHVTVQGLDQPHGPSQLVNGADASAGQAACAISDIIVNIASREHRVLAWREERVSQKFVDSALEIFQLL